MYVRQTKRNVGKIWSVGNAILFVFFLCICFWQTWNGHMRLQRQSLYHFNELAPDRPSRLQFDTKTIFAIWVGIVQNQWLNNEKKKQNKNKEKLNWKKIFNSENVSELLNSILGKWFVMDFEFQVFQVEIERFSSRIWLQSNERITIPFAGSSFWMDLLPDPWPVLLLQTRNFDLF